MARLRPLAAKSCKGVSVSPALAEERLHAAIKRNAFEVAHALLDWKALAAIERCLKSPELYVTRESIVTIANRALFNDLIAHAIKVLDTDGDSATFWAITNAIPEKVKALASYSQDKIIFLKTLSEKLKLVRNKTHFHIDKKAVLDPKEIWHLAKIRGTDLHTGLIYAWDIIRELHQVVCGREFRDVVGAYEAEEIPHFMEWARSAGLMFSDGAQAHT